MMITGTPGGHVEGLRRTRGEAAGTQPGSSSAERTTTNTGTAPAPWQRESNVLMASTPYGPAQPVG